MLLKSFIHALLFIFFISAVNAQNNTRTYTDKNGVYEVQLPAAWKSEKARMIVQFTVEDPVQRKRQLTLEKIRLYDANTSLTTEKIHDTLLAGLQADSKKKLLDKNFVTIDGMKWSYIYYTSNNLRFKAYNIIYKTVRYAFYYIAPQDDYEAGEQIAKECIESFRFLDKPVTAANASAVITQQKAPVSVTPVTTTATQKVPEKPVVQNNTSVTIADSKKIAVPNIAAEATAPKENFVCDSSHKPYKYYCLTWETNLTNSKKSGISILGKLPANTNLQAVSFITNKVYPVKTAKGQYIDDEGVSFNFTNIDGFPASIERQHQAGQFSKNLLVIQNAKPADFSLLGTTISTDAELKKTFAAKITEMVTSQKFINDHKIKAEYYQNEFNKAVRKPVGKIEKVLIPGLECYFISLKDEYDGAAFISINGKMIFVSAAFFQLSYEKFFYKINNNYFLFLESFGRFDVFEIRDSGLKGEWHYAPDTEISNFGDAAEQREQAKKMVHQ